MERLRTQEAREAYLDTDLLKSTGNLFLMLDDVWICKDCRKSVEEDKRPTNSAMNGLGATWYNLPPPLMNLSIEELDTIAFTQIFSVVHSLSAGDTGDTGDTGDQPNKILLLPLKRPQHDEGRPDDAAAKLSAVLQLHSKPSGEEHEVRTEQMLEALTYLLQHNGGKYKGKREALFAWFQEKGQEEGSTQMLDPNPVEDSGRGRIYATVLPVVSDLLTDAKQILYCGPLDTRTRDLFDVHGESGLDLGREESITDREWMVHRLQSVFRRGPSNDVVLIMSMLLKLELSWLSQVRGVSDILTGALMKHKGTKEYFEKARDDIKAMERCYGPANFSFSATMNAESCHFLAAFVAQSGETDGFEDLQVWDHQDELELLTLRPGMSHDDLESAGYFVHQKSSTRYDNCMGHTNCRRSPLQDWGRW